MQILAGTESGQLKLVQCVTTGKAIPKVVPFEANAKLKMEEVSKKMNMQCSTFFPVDKEKSILAMSFAEYENSKVILLARKNGELDIWHPVTHTLIKTIQIFASHTNYAGLIMLNDSTSLVANENGDIIVVNLKESEIIHTLSLNTTISSLRHSSSHPHVLAFGGKETDLCILDINGSNGSKTLSNQKYKGFKSSLSTNWNGECNLYFPWRASNEKKDSLGLKIPIWITDLQFLNPECTRIATCTAYHELKFYLTTQSRHPIRVVELGNHPFRSMCLSNPDTIFVSTSAGQVLRYSFLKYKNLGSYKGATGSVTQVSASDDHHTLVAVGLDRMIRSFDVSSRALTGKWFAKQRLHCVLVLDAETTVTQEHENEEKDEWDLLDELSQKRREMKRQRRKEKLENISESGQTSEGNLKKLKVG